MLVLQLLPAQALLPLADTTVLPRDFSAFAASSWALLPRGTRVLTFSLDAGDTLLYTLSRVHNRRMRMTIEDKEGNIMDIHLKPHISIGAFKVIKSSTYLLRLQNQSLWLNTASVELRKNPLRTPMLAPPLLAAKISPFVPADPEWVVYDSTVYLAPELNMKKHADVLIALDSTSHYVYYLRAASNITIQGPHGALALKECLLQRNQKDRATLLIERYPKTHRSHTVGTCLLRLNHTLVVQNTDKVVGKYLHIRIKTLKPIAKPLTYEE